MRRWLGRIGAGAGVVLVATVLPVGVAGAGPGSKASCMGHEAAGISPPGSSDELPGGAPQLKAFVDSLGGHPGAVYSVIAHLHEGSHEACDEALE